MKKNFLKIGLSLAMVLTFAVFYSCEKDNNDKVIASTINAANVINGSSKIAVVKAEIDCNLYDYESCYYSIAENQYKNNGFTLKLPAIVAAKYLEPFWEDDDESMTGVTVSDETVRGIGLSDFVAYDKDGEKLGQLVCMDVNLLDYEGDIVKAVWFYIDKKVIINGQGKREDVEYNEEHIIKLDNVTFKKGWNICYVSDTYSYNQSTNKETYTSTLSNKKPSGVTLNWYYHSFYDEAYGASLKSATSLSGKNFFFSRLKVNKR